MFISYIVTYLQAVVSQVEFNTILVGCRYIPLLAGCTYIVDQNNAGSTQSIVIERLITSASRSSCRTRNEHIASRQDSVIGKNEGVVARLLELDGRGGSLAYQIESREGYLAIEVGKAHGQQVEIHIDQIVPGLLDYPFVIGIVLLLFTEVHLGRIVVVAHITGIPVAQLRVELDFALLQHTLPGEMSNIVVVARHNRSQLIVPPVGSSVADNIEIEHTPFIGSDSYLFYR